MKQKKKKEKTISTITLIVLTNENSVRKTLANYSFRIGFMYII